jgi:cytosine/adenosine deaminase-related metal-dependent hydrolase
LKFLKADWVLTCDDEFSIIKDGGVVFEDKIVDINCASVLEEKYSNLDVEYCGKNSVLMPGLINSHVHLEFSGNKTTLKYGNFLDWLTSVIENREELIEKATEDLIDSELKAMLKTGTTSIGAISSYGFDMSSCIKTDMNVVYFTEVIGSKPDMIDTLFVDFKAKLESTKQNCSTNFIPAIAIHSPYSVHPFLIREVLKIAKENDMPVSAHFQESKSENDWLNYNKGSFISFFKNFLQQTTAVTKPNEFLSQFKGIENLSFTHCVEANAKELEQIKDMNATIIHCPKSNRLLNNTSLNLNYLDDISLAMGTDGLSSNNSLSLFDEMQSALFIHRTNDINDLSKRLLTASTNGGAKALGLNKGQVAKGKDADLISFSLPDTCSEEDIATAVILHTKQVDKTYIQGKHIELS